MRSAAFVFHLDSTLSLKLFPAGKHNEIDWNHATFSEDSLDFYDLKDSGTNEKSYVEYSPDNDLNIEPIRLKETVRYKCSISYSRKVDGDVFTQFNPHLKNESNKFLKLERDDSSSLTFQFINYLGKTGLIFSGKDGEHHLPFEVVPDKINYEEDYVKLTEAIADECSALLLDYTSPTALTFRQDSSKDSSILEQFIFLRQFCFSDNLESLFASIKRNPDRLLVKEEELRPFGSGIPSQKFFSNPFSHSRSWMQIGEGSYLPGEVTTIHKYDSYDTPANRFIKFALLSFSELCEKVLEKVEIDKDGKEYFSEAQRILNQIDDILNDTFFDDINDLEIMPVNNQILEKREGYSQIFNAFSMLDLALQLDWKGKDEVYTGEAKNTALLYEYWLFFELRKIIHELTGKDKSTSALEPYKQFISDANGLTISLQQGNASLQSFTFEKENLTVNLYYNRTFSPAQFSSSIYWGSYSRPFRPDYTLAIFSSDYRKETDAIKAGEVSYIHFDAKYRIQDLTQFINSDTKELSDDSLAKPEEQITKEENEEIIQEKADEVINTYKRGDLLKMHTYNDAIRRTVGSYVLYPGNEKNAKRNEQASVYDEILPGVGAFAIRPGNRNAGHEEIKKFVRQVIDFKANEASRKSRSTYFENMVITTPSEGKEFIAEKSSNDYQMIGFIRNEYLDFLITNKLIPVSKEDFYSKQNQTFYFYFYAIKSGKVYTIHKETAKAKYLRLTNTDINECKVEYGYKFRHLLPWEAEIQSMELVSKESMNKKLNDLYAPNLFIPKDGFHADYYYLVKAIVTRFIEDGITAINATENDDISVYSPKIIERIV